jgi:hypothetical protein
MHGADHLAPLAHRLRPAAAAAAGPAALQHGIARQQMQLWGRMEAEIDANTAALTARLRLQLPAVELHERAWRFRLAGLGFPHAMHGGVGRVGSPHRRRACGLSAGVGGGSW